MLMGQSLHDPGPFLQLVGLNMPAGKSPRFIPEEGFCSFQFLLDGYSTPK